MTSSMTPPAISRPSVTPSHARAAAKQISPTSSGEASQASRRSVAANEKSVNPPSTDESRIAARAAGLRYVTDDAPGIRRKFVGRGVVYRGADGRVIKDRETINRIRHLAIPPAWTNVWICPISNGHIQATGRDARGRKQYRYHDDWKAERDSNKFERTIAFGRALPRIRAAVGRDLRRRKLDRRKVLAAIVRLLETTLIRIGNEEYARNNHSFGLSTMRDRHVSIARGTLHFEFRGKSGRKHEIDLHDPRLAQIVRQAQDLPGQDLFQYVDDRGEPQKIGSSDVSTKSLAQNSRRKTFAPGRAPCWRRSHCGNSKSSTPRRRRKRT
jgi:DNA topoisomerase-1